MNRSLVVVGKRPDGFHELDTVFQTVDLTDELSFEEADRISLEVDDPAIPANEENLVIKAATALAKRFGVTRGASIRLTKRIPAGAGLGGGSGNAAGALRGLAALWSLAPTEVELHGLAQGLGSDVPFFLVGGRARGRGRGEILEPLPDGPEEALVILVPPFPLATPDVYRRLRANALTGSGPETNLPASGAADEPDRNDLEPAAESLRSEVRELRHALSLAGARSARLSGSGSAVFGVFDDVRFARDAATRLSGVPPGTRVEVVRTVSREEFRRRSFPRPAP